MKHILFAWCVGAASALVVCYGFGFPGEGACGLGIIIGGIAFVGVEMDSENP